MQSVWRDVDKAGPMVTRRDVVCAVAAALVLLTFVLVTLTVLALATSGY